MPQFCLKIRKSAAYSFCMHRIVIPLNRRYSSQVSCENPIKNRNFETVSLSLWFSLALSLFPDLLSKPAFHFIRFPNPYGSLLFLKIYVLSLTFIFQVNRSYVILCVNLLRKQLLKTKEKGFSRFQRKFLYVEKEISELQSTDHHGRSPPMFIQVCETAPGAFDYVSSRAAPQTYGKASPYDLLRMYGSAGGWAVGDALSELHGCLVDFVLSF